jgi:hypothetical protein
MSVKSIFDVLKLLEVCLAHRSGGLRARHQHLFGSGEGLMVKAPQQQEHGQKRLAGLVERAQV